MLTLANPTTILSFIAIFAALNTSAASGSYAAAGHAGAGRLRRLGGLVALPGAWDRRHPPPHGRAVLRWIARGLRRRSSSALASIRSGMASPQLSREGFGPCRLRAGGRFARFRAISPTSFRPLKGSGPMSLDRAAVRHIATLARIRVSDRGSRCAGGRSRQDPRLGRAAGRGRYRRRRADGERRRAQPAAARRRGDRRQHAATRSWPMRRSRRSASSPCPRWWSDERAHRSDHRRGARRARQEEASARAS